MASSLRRVARGQPRVQGDKFLRAPSTMPSQQRRGSPAKTELLLKLHLESNPEALALVRAAVQSFAEVLHFSEAHSRAIVRSVDEALANVIRHAYKGREGRPIEVKCNRLWKDKEKRSAGGIEIVLEDLGVAVDPKKLQGRALDEIRPGGLGLHFIRESMDVVEFRRNHGKNLLRLVKYLPPSDPEVKQEGE